MESGLPTAAQVGAAVAIVRAVGDAIRDLGSVPSGELYARLMSKMDIHAYTKTIDVLIGAKLVKRSNHLLTWIGPAKEEKHAS